MEIKTRILASRLLEKMRDQRDYCDKLGLTDTSSYRKKSVDTGEKKNKIENKDHQGGI